MKKLNFASIVVAFCFLITTSFAFSQNSCDTLRNYSPNDTQYQYSASSGLFLGHAEVSAGQDDYQVDQWVEPYNFGTSTENIKAVRLAPWKLQNNSGNASLSVQVFDDNNGEPGSLIGSQDILFSDLTVNFWNLVEFTTPVAVTGKVYVGYALEYSAPVDSFALLGTEPATNTYTTFHISGPGSLNDTWHDAETVFGGNSAFLLEVLTGSGTPPVAEFEIDQEACVSGSFAVDGSNSTGTIDKYEWFLTNDPPDFQNPLDESLGAVSSLSPINTSADQHIYLFVSGACSMSGLYAPVSVYPDVTATVDATDETCQNENGEINISNVNGGGGNTLYSIDGGVNTQPGSSFTDLAAGTYEVIISAEGNGCEYSETISLINTSTESINVGSDQTICENSSATLTASGNGTIEWFENGNSIGTGASITVSPTATTTYEATLTDGNGCSDTKQVTVEITPLEDASFDYASNTLCLGAINESPSNIATSGGTFTSSGTGLVFVDATTGEIDMSSSTANTYDITYTTSGSPGLCSNSETQTITITDNPDASFSYPNTEYCQSAGVVDPTFPAGASAGTFTVTPSGLTIVPGSGAINFASSDNGIFTITNTIAASGTCPAASETISITVNENPTVNAGADQEVCEGNEVTLNATTSNGTISWDNSVTDGTPFVPSATTTYTVSVDDDGCISTDEVTVTVTPPPSVDAGADQEICEGNEVTLNASAPNGTISWDNSVIDGEPFVPSETTTYTVTVDNNGCIGTDEVTVTLTPPPSIDAGADQEVCDGDQITLEATPSNGTVIWDNNVINGIPFTPTETTTYTVEVNYNGCSSTDQVVVTVNPIPNVSAGTDQTACVHHDVLELTGSPAGGTFSGEGVSGSNFDPETAGVGTHPITYTYTDENTGCENTATIVITVDGCMGVDKNEMNELTVSPNPASNFIEVSVAENNSIHSIQFLSIDGKVVPVEFRVIDKQTTQIDVSSIAKGTYFIQLTLEKGQITRKVIVQ